MGCLLDSLPHGGRIAIIRLRSLGDCVLTTPALRLLKQARPDARIGVVVEERWAAVFEGNPDVSELLAPRSLRRWAPGLCLNLHGGTRSASLAATSGARLRAGFAHFRPSWIYNARIPRAQQILEVSRKVHTAEHLASAVFFLGVPQSEIPRACLFAEPQGGAPYAVIHPFGSEPAKTWAAGGFLEMAESLKPRLEPVFIGGAGEDLSPFARYRIAQGAPLRKLKSLIAGASLFLGNDSGPAHMAAAFGVPAVVLFGASDPEIWGPWRTPSEVVSGPAGITSIRPEQVMGALERLSASGEAPMAPQPPAGSARMSRGAGASAAAFATGW
ncbi:MAG: glycosyltransferase family 9 protein [Acidobacteria bacterium]|nr:glycosyltransferase family 9 protein [Acidobacteriota bacterium]